MSSELVGESGVGIYVATNCPKDRTNDMEIWDLSESQNDLTIESTMVHTIFLLFSVFFCERKSGLIGSSEDQEFGGLTIPGFPKTLRYCKGGVNMSGILNRERGFTIVEVVVAQAILIIGAVAIWSVFTTGARLNAESEDKTIAANVARLKMEEIMNTRFRYIVAEYPAGETAFDSEPQGPPYWTRNSGGAWMPSLPVGRYQVGYPDGEDADPLRIKVTVLWQDRFDRDSSLSLETFVSMTPGRFRG
jgi:type II secretory pathway pseudopilin PulG